MRLAVIAAAATGLAACGQPGTSELPVIEVQSVTSGAVTRALGSAAPVVIVNLSIEAGDSEVALSQFELVGSDGNRWTPTLPRGVAICQMPDFANQIDLSADSSNGDLVFAVDEGARPVSLEWSLGDESRFFALPAPRVACQ